jgi:hypothetical protein
MRIIFLLILTALLVPKEPEYTVVIPPTYMKTAAIVSQITSYKENPYKTQPEIYDPIPKWVMRGILYTETSSYYSSTGKIVYKNKKRSSAGAIGPFQMKKIAFDEVKNPGESFYKLETDTEFAEEIARRYLLYLHKRGKSWSTAIQMYYVGPSDFDSSVDSRAYLQKVRTADK